jgi:GntR family transcriptional regulator of vanillate catabolism
VARDPNINPKSIELQASGHGARIVYQLSQLIVRGELVAGEKLAEIPLAERFGVSRTPIRYALSVLEKEGLLVRDSSRSFVIRRFSVEEILDAIEVRSVLEGLAAREVAQRRLPWGAHRELESILNEAGEVINEVESHGLTSALTERYFNANERFHSAIIAAANSHAISTAIEVTMKVPFASVGSIARYSDAEDESASATREKSRLLLFSHLQHQDIFEALAEGNAARAESLMRDHAHLGARNLQLHDATAIRRSY